MIVLDTLAWVWWAASPERLSKPARARIDREIEEGAVHVSAISCWEVSLLVRRGRLALSLDVADWIATMETLPFLRFVPIDNRIALRSNSLAGDLHEDPADRLIVATAQTLGAALITKDARLQSYPHVETVW